MMFYNANIYNSHEINTIILLIQNTNKKCMEMQANNKIDRLKTFNTIEDIQYNSQHDIV